MMKKFAFVALAAMVGMSVAHAGDAAKGKELFEANCAVCHNADSEERKMGPGLKGLYKQAKLKSSGKAPSDATVGAKIDEGGNGMPPYKDTLNAKEKADLLAYMKTL